MEITKWLTLFTAVFFLSGAVVYGLFSHDVERWFLRAALSAVLFGFYGIYIRLDKLIKQ